MTTENILKNKGGNNMNCPNCGSKLDTGYNCTKCDYRYIKIEDTTNMTSKQIQVTVNLWIREKRK